jgi:chemotaxis protein methyltransferase CheR
MTAGADLAAFRALLGSRLGWAFADSDLPQLDQVLARRSETVRLSPAAYLSRFGTDNGWDEAAALAEELTITETYFFRHGEQFRALVEDVLPERVRARAGQQALNLLSVGCSSGEEAYSLAILAHEARPDPGWTVSVLGLDANPAMLARAAAARYLSWSLRETPDATRERWFHPHDGIYELDARIRDTVRFRRHNVADDEPGLWPPEQYDVVFCRNLLMYLTPATAGTLIRRMTRSLVKGGYLFLGHTDSLGPRPDGLEARHSHHTFYYRRPLRAPALTARPVPGELPVRRKVPPAPPGSDRHDRVLALAREERFADALALVESDLDRSDLDRSDLDRSDLDRSDLDGADPEARPQRRDLLLHGVLLAQAGRIEDAEIVSRRLLDVDGLYADAHHLLGVCLEGGAAVDVAIGHYRLAAHLDPAFAMPRLRLGLLSRRCGDDRAAGPELDRALHLLRDEHDERIVLFGGGFGRIALTALCRAELDACGVRR